MSQNNFLILTGRVSVCEDRLIWYEKLNHQSAAKLRFQVLNLATNHRTAILAI